MNPVYLRHLPVGAGKPKVIVPILGSDREEIMAQAQALKGRSLDVVEFRADFYRDVIEPAALQDTLKALRRSLGEVPILFTFRTKEEGGERAISPDDYAALNLLAARSGWVDGVDVQFFPGGEEVNNLIRSLHAAGAVVVGSNHDFRATPPEEEIIRRLCLAQELGCDILKLAVMPQTSQDVFTLLSATRRMLDCHARQPLVTMSMGKLGVLSRLCGELSGSSMTFGTAGHSSAPGQVEVERLGMVLDILHDVMTPNDHS